MSIFAKDKRFSAYTVGLLATAVLVPGLAGFLDLRERLHRAEEALIGVEPASLAVGEAGYDVRRIEGGRFADSKRLLADIEAAQTALTTNPDDAAARAKLRQARRAINEYRDSLRGGLIPARDHLFATPIYASLNA